MEQMPARTGRAGRRSARPWAGFVFLIGLATAAAGQTLGPGSRPDDAPHAIAAANDSTRVPARPIGPGLRLVGPNGAVEVLGVKFVGVNAENGRKLLLTVVFAGIVLLLGRGARALVYRGFRERRDERAAFWSRQAVSLATAVVMILGLASIWFDDPARLATVLGLVTAGLAFALQKVVTAVSGYFVILRGKTFNVGDRITMGGVRGDVIALGFIQTTIMEMGQPPSVAPDADPAMWVRSRQYTGRVVTVTNDKIFDEPVFNYTRDFPYIWEELRLPVAFRDDRARAEQILLEAARKHAVAPSELTAEALDELKRRYVLKSADLTPRVYYRLTGDWLELTVRFVVRDHGIREVKDAMTREILPALEAAGIGIASTSFEIAGLPPVRLVAAPGLSVTGSESSHRAPTSPADAG